MQSETAKRLLEKLKQLRLRRGLSQEKFSEVSHFGYKYYQALEAGRKKDLRLSTLVRLAQAHDLEVWELLLPDMPAQAVAEPAVKDPGPVRSKSRKKARRPTGR